MPKLFFLLSIVFTGLLWFFLFPFPTKVSAFAPVTCNSQYDNSAKVTDVTITPFTVQTGTDVTVLVQFDKNNIQPKDINGNVYNFQVLASSNDTLLAKDAWSDPVPITINGNQAYAQFTIKGSNFKTPLVYTLKLHRNPSTGPNPGNSRDNEICSNLHTLNVFSPLLAQAKCSFNIPTNIKTGSPAQVTNVSTTVTNGLTYNFYIFKQSANSSGVKKVLSSIGANAVVSITSADQSDLSNALYHSTANNQADYDKITSETSNLKLDNDSYIAFILVGGEYNSNTNVTSSYVCATQNFQVTSQDTTNPTTSTTVAAPGTTSGTNSLQNPTTKSQTSFDCVTDTSDPLYKDKACTTTNGAACAATIDEARIGPSGFTGVNTAIGCIPSDPSTLIQGLFRFALGAGGGISLLLMAFGALQMITSQGNAEALKNGQGRFTSAIIGLLFIIFSVFLLKIIGVDILQIPGFQGS